jgi:hypothetical protein
MEQAFRHCDKDTLKMAMLKHEEIFRQQVIKLKSSKSFPEFVEATTSLQKKSAVLWSTSSYLIPQVHELHRLYRIQKLLMRDFTRELKLKSQRSLPTSPNGSCAEYSRGAAGSSVPLAT